MTITSSLLIKYLKGYLGYVFATCILPESSCAGTKTRILGICLQILKSGDYRAVSDKEGGCDLESGSFMLDRPPFRSSVRDRCISEAGVVFNLMSCPL